MKRTCLVRSLFLMAAALSSLHAEAKWRYVFEKTYATVQKIDQGYLYDDLGRSVFVWFYNNGYTVNGVNLGKGFEIQPQTSGTNTTVGASGDLDFTDVTADTGFPVLGLATSAFYGSTTVTSIVAPDLRRLGHSAFSMSTSITNAVFSEKLMTLETNAFRQKPPKQPCGPLLKFSPTKLPLVREIGEYAFYNQSLTDWEGGFEMTNLVKVGANVFLYSPGFKGDLHAPNLTNVLGCAFQGTGITSLYAPALESVGDEAFRDCASLTSVTVGTNLTAVGKYGFIGCKAMHTFTPFLPPGMTSLGLGSFGNCVALTNNLVYDCPAIPSIPDQFVRNCCGVTNVLIRSAVTAIGSLAFNKTGMPTSGTFKNHSLLKAYFEVARPTTFPENAFGAMMDANYRPQIFYLGKHADTWLADGFVLPLTSSDKKRADYPGRKTIGKFKTLGGTANNEEMYDYLVRWTDPGLMVIVR